MLLEMLQLPPEQIKGPYCPATSKIGLVTRNGQESQQHWELSSGNSGGCLEKILWEGLHQGRTPECCCVPAPTAVSPLPLACPSSHWRPVLWGLCGCASTRSHHKGNQGKNAFCTWCPCSIFPCSHNSGSSRSLRCIFGGELGACQSPRLCFGCQKALFLKLFGFFRVQIHCQGLCHNTAASPKMDG